MDCGGRAQRRHRFGTHRIRRILSGHASRRPHIIRRMGGARPITLTFALAAACLCRNPSPSAPVAVASPEAVTIGQSFTVRIEDAPPGNRAKWRVNTRARFLKADSLRNEATFEAIANGQAIVTANLGTQEISATVTVGEPSAPPAPTAGPTPHAARSSPAADPPITPDPSPGASRATSPSLEDLLAKEAALARQLAENPDPDGARAIAALRAEIAELLARAGDVARAVEFLGSSLFLDGRHPARWERLGDLAELIMEPALTGTTHTAYETALLLDPGRAGARIKLIGSYLGSRNFEDAIPHLEYLVSRGEEAPPDWLHIALLATAYTAVDRLDDGRQFFSDRATESGDNRFVVACAMLENAAGDSPMASRLLAHVARSEPPGSAIAALADRLREMFADAPPGGAR